jgi:FAD/FMN-containing dehydrogenase
VKVPGLVNSLLQITCANQHNIPFLATSARHGYSTSLASIHNGLEINTGYLNQININAFTNRMTIGGAVRFQQAVDILYASGKEIRVFPFPLNHPITIWAKNLTKFQF